MGANTKGRYIRKVGYLDIRAKDTHKRGEARGKWAKEPVGSTELVIYHSKKQLVNGLKNIEEAVAKCKELMGPEKCKLYNL
jgi:hypothetical protein